MQKITKDIVVFYHGGCRDGFGGAWAAYKKFGNKADYVPLYREDPVPYVKNKRQVYFIDFLYNEEAVTKKFVKDNARVVGLDHHETTKEAIKYLAEDSVYSNIHSGSVLAWKYFHPGKKTPTLLKYVEDRDTWGWRLPHSKDLNSALTMLEYDFLAWNKTAAELENSAKRKKYIETGKIMTEQFASQVKELVSEARVINFDGHKVLAVNAPHMFTAELGHALAKKMPPFGIVWVREGDASHLSFRSAGTFDVAKLAKKFGGGGHKMAAGVIFKDNKKIPWE